MTIDINKLLETFAVLKPDLSVRTVRVTPSLYQELDAEFETPGEGTENRVAP